MGNQQCTESGGTGAALLDTLLTICARSGASDLHLSPGLPPHLRTHGVLAPIEATQPIRPEQTAAIATALLDGRPLDWSRGSIDGAVSAKDGTRFRFNLFLRQGVVAAAIRRLDDGFRTLSELGLPDSLYNLCEFRDGLVIVAGPTGAGKSTTLATLIDRINRTRACHILTIEDPIEYIHNPVLSVVNQRQLGQDAPTFNDALVASLRQDPDVILVGEIRDLETIRTAITAAETGHLVFTTLHAGDCVGSIERLVAVFPSDEQDGVRRQLSLVLRAIIAQHLLPAVSPANQRRQCAASEVLFTSTAVANLIATGKSTQIYSSMESGQAAGMQTLEQDLARLWVGGAISELAAVACARNVGVLRDRAAILRRRDPRNSGLGR